MPNRPRKHGGKALVSKVFGIRQDLGAFFYFNYQEKMDVIVNPLFICLNPEFPYFAAVRRRACEHRDMREERRVLRHNTKLAVAAARERILLFVKQEGCLAYAIWLNY